MPGTHYTLVFGQPGRLVWPELKRMQQAIKLEVCQKWDPVTTMGLTLYKKEYIRLILPPLLLNAQQFLFFFFSLSV